MKWMEEKSAAYDNNQRKFFAMSIIFYHPMKILYVKLYLKDAMLFKKYVFRP